MSGAAGAPVLAVRDLTVTVPLGGAVRALVDGVSFDLARGEILGLVGESGSGKTLACRALIRLLPSPSMRIAAGSVVLHGRDLIPLSEAEMTKVLGGEIGMIFQNPSSHLDPVMRIGEQIAESVRFHEGVGRREARGRAIEALWQVGIPDPAGRVDSYPHEFSGGMRQRAMIAVALACNPDVLIADEPTTALDVTVQAQILRLLMDLRDRRGLSIVLITHDLGIVAQTCDSIAVLYGGRIAERGPKRTMLARPAHPYTAGLIRCQPATLGGKGLLDTIAGQPPTADAMPSGCRFHPRCPNALPICRELQPSLMPFAPGQVAACHNPVVQAPARASA
jgi:oligopeptide/dipeptide ABC transporter ATP-binding protein